MTTNKTTGLTRSKFDRTKGLGVRHRVARSISALSSGFSTQLTVPVGHVALIDEISISATLATAVAANTESVTVRFVNYEDQTNVYLTTRPGNVTASNAPDGSSTLTAVTTDALFYFTRTANAIPGQGDNRTQRYVWKLNGDLCLASSDVIGQTASISVKPSFDFSGLAPLVAIHIQYRIMSRQAAIAQGEFKNSFIRATAASVPTTSADIVKSKLAHSIEVNAIAATGNARTTATNEDIRLRFSDHWTTTPSVNRTFFRVNSRSNTSFSIESSVTSFYSGLHIQGPPDYRLTSLASANVGSTMSVVVVGRYVKGRKDILPNSTGVDRANNQFLAIGTATSSTANTLVDSGKTWATGGSGAYAGQRVRITTGLGAGQVREITSNTATTLTVSANWDTNPDTTSTYQIFSYDTLHDTWDTTGTSVTATGGSSTDASFDVYGNPRGGKYFWFYTELKPTTPPEVCFPYTPTSASTALLDAVGILRGYHYSASAATAPMSASVTTTGTPSTNIIEQVYHNFQFQTVTQGRDDLALPFSTCGRGLGAAGADDTTNNLSFVRNANAAQENGVTIWGTLEPLGNYGSLTSAGRSAISGILDLYSGT